MLPNYSNGSFTSSRRRNNFRLHFRPCAHRTSARSPLRWRIARITGWRKLKSWVATLGGREHHERPWRRGEDASTRRSGVPQGQIAGTGNAIRGAGPWQAELHRASAASRNGRSSKTGPKTTYFGAGGGATASDGAREGSSADTRLKGERIGRRLDRPNHLGYPRIESGIKADCSEEML